MPKKGRKKAERFRREYHREQMRASRVFAFNDNRYVTCILQPDNILTSEFYDHLVPCRCIYSDIQNCKLKNACAAPENSVRTALLRHSISF